MKIALATPLYPPDVAWPAPYTKELARRLSTVHEVTVVTYGDLPEKVAGVKILTTSKRRPLPLRILSYTKLLWRAARQADVIYAENGPSVELPLVIVSLFCKTPVIFHIGDERAHAYAAQHKPRHALEQVVVRHAKKIVSDSPAPRPEVLPFADYPTNAMAAHEASWLKHTEEIGDVFIYAKQ